MSPYERIVELYEGQSFPAWTLEDTVRWYFMHGTVLSTPEFFAMGRLVRKSAPMEQILSPVVFDDPDCWYVHALAGDMAAVWRCLPVQMPWIAFDQHVGTRRNLGLRFYPSASMRRHCMKGGCELREVMA